MSQMRIPVQGILCNFINLLNIARYQKCRQLIVLSLLFICGFLSTYGQSNKRPSPPAGQTCDDVTCLKTTDKVVAVNLDKRYRQNGSIPAEQLSHVVWLSLKNNRLKSLPAWLCDCTRLEVLDLSKNQLHHLPDCLGDLKSLRYLSVNRNPISFLPNRLATLDSLEVVDLWQTWIDNFSPDFARWQGKVKHIDLRDIRMTREQQAEIRKLFPGTDVAMSAPCNCRPHRP